MSSRRYLLNPQSIAAVVPIAQWISSSINEPMSAPRGRLFGLMFIRQLKLDKLIVGIPPLSEAPKRVDFSERYIEK